MALKIVDNKGNKFGIGDTVKIIQTIKEGEKTRKQVFEGIVLKVRGRQENKSITVRRMGVGQVGIERIFQLISPAIEKIEVVRQGTRGVRRAKLYYLRKKSKREIEKIYARSKKRAKLIKSAKGKITSKKS